MELTTDGSGSGYGYGYGYGDGDGDGSGYGDWTVERDAPLIAWHVVPPDGRLRFDHDGERPHVAAGLVLTHDEDTLELCKAGLHASIDLDDALAYCGGVVTRVACSGRVIFGRDKLTCSRREVLEVYASLADARKDIEVGE